MVRALTVSRGSASFDQVGDAGLDVFEGLPGRQIFSTVRRGTARYPKVQAFTTALKAYGPSQTAGLRGQ
jgi:hypothetical protein